MGPAYNEISQRFWKNPKEFEEAFAKAWYKLTHRDMGPHSRLIGTEVPEAQYWQDPVPARDPAQMAITEPDLEGLKSQLLSHADLSITALINVAWASVSTFRISDFR